MPALPLPPLLLLDGGMGTALIARGLEPAREPADVWNLRQPERVRDAHLRFAQAGCRALQTNSFGASRLRLRSFGLEAEVAAINQAALELAHAAGPDLIVIGSIGPTALLPPPQGDADLTELEDNFAEQAALLGPGVALLHLETFYHPKELRAALRGARAGAPEVPIVASFTCSIVGTQYKTTLGFPPETMINVILEERADGTGVNCSLPPRDLLPLVTALVERTRLPVFAKPIVAPSDAPPLLPEEFAEGVMRLFEAGAAAVGGCCGTGPADLAAAAALLAGEQPHA